MSGLQTPPSNTDYSLVIQGPLATFSPPCSLLQADSRGGGSDCNPESKYVGRLQVKAT